MMNKKGFTLIEIIICVTLISLIGVGTTVVVFNKKNETKTVYESNSKNFENALEVYLSNNKEVVENINNYVDGAVVSLEVLKNNGLIDDNIKGINYKKDYFLLSNAVLASNPTDEDCKNRISIETIKSWDLSKYDSSKVIYICPKETTTINNDYKQYLMGTTNTYIAKGKNPNNWVQVDYKFSDSYGIKNSQKILYNSYYEDNSTESLWRIVAIDNDSMRLILNTNVADEWSGERGEKLPYSDIFDTVVDPSNIQTKTKDLLYSAINLKDHIKKANYLSNYHTSNGDYGARKAIIQEFNPSQFYIGIISKKEIEDSIINGATYLNDGKEYILGHYTYGPSEYDGCISYNGTFKTTGVNLDDLQTIYKPVITFDNKVKLVENKTSTCKSGATLGSVECPYRLSVD